ncbi:L-saccharopine oxidase [Colletotrichum sp. SAR 10_75]|nr:L-saccharopine oxidase [Colletotrichum sp. SAR 10_75]
MGPMRLPYQVTYKSDNSTHAMNENDETYKIDFIPWIQQHPIELLALATGRHPGGRVPTRAEIAKDPSLGAPPVMTSAECNNTKKEMNKVLKNETLITEIQANIWRAHKQVMDLVYNDWSEQSLLRNRLKADENVTDAIWTSTDYDVICGHIRAIAGGCPQQEATQAASVDHNKIFRASYGKNIHYQRLALESRSAWEKINELRREEKNEEERSDLFSGCGMLRVQPDANLGALERETLRNFERDGLRDTQFVKSDPTDRQRATERGWDSKLIEFAIPDSSSNQSFEAVLDSTAGFTKCSEACAYFYKVAERQGVVFHFGPQKGGFGSLIEENVPESSTKRAIGLKTKDGAVHKADVVVIAAGSFSTQLLPELSYHLESSAGSVVTFKVDKDDERLWDKYSPERFPVITWKSAARTVDGKDIGSIYVFPRTSDGLIKIGYRGIKFTNFQPAPPDAGFTQDGKWSVPMSPADSRVVPDRAREAIKPFVSIFLPDFKEQDFYSTKMCWYTDSLDNSFVIDYVPNYADNSVFVCTGGSGHGAKFLPVLGEHAADILLNAKYAAPLRAAGQERMILR